MNLLEVLFREGPLLLGRPGVMVIDECDTFRTPPTHNARLLAVLRLQSALHVRTPILVVLKTNTGHQAKAKLNTKQKQHCNLSNTEH